MSDLKDWTDLARVRERAESVVRMIRPNAWRSPDEETARLMYELEVHEVELNMQNHELRAALARAESAKSRLTDLYELAPIGYVSLDIDGRIILANLMAATILGTERRSLLGSHLASFLDEEEAKVFHHFWREIDGTKRAIRGDFALARRDSIGTRMVRVDATAIESEQEGHCRAALYDITDHHRATEELRRREEEQRAILDAAVDAIITIDESGRIQRFNPAAERMFRRAASDVVGRGVELLVPDDHRERHQDCIGRYLRTGEVRDTGLGCELEAVRADGERFPVHLAVSEFDVDNERRFVGIVRDLSEQKRMQANMIEAQKLEIVGRLASGIAHDFNNLLMGLIGTAEIALGVTESDHPARTLLQEIRRAATGGSTVVRQLLQSAREQPPREGQSEMNTVVADGNRMLQRLLGEDVMISLELHDHDLPVPIERGGLETILMNLAINARHAMPQGGCLALTTCVREIDDDEGELCGVEPGVYAVLRVADTGVGMDRKTRERVFEPFFTTKGTGGTGLGLSTALGTAAQAGGCILIDSEVGRGSVFDVCLPLLRRIEPGPTVERTTVPPGARVLVVDDEPLVRMTTAYYLNEMGYRAFEAKDMEEAEALCEREDNRFDVLVTDMVLLGRQGHEIATILRQRIPGLKVVYMSAHSAETLRRQGRLGEGETALQKPFDQDALRAILGPSED